MTCLKKIDKIIEQINKENNSSKKYIYRYIIITMNDYEIKNKTDLLIYQNVKCTSQNFD